MRLRILRRAANGDSDVGALGAHDVTCVAKRHDDAFADVVCGFRIGRRQHHHELRTAVPGNQIRLTGVAAQNARGRL